MESEGVPKSNDYRDVLLPHNDVGSEFRWNEWIASMITEELAQAIEETDAGYILASGRVIFEDASLESLFPGLRAKMLSSS